MPHLGNLGWIEASLKKDDIALTTLRKAVMADPNDGINRISLGLFYERQRFNNDAMEQYARALVGSPRIVDSAFFKELQARNQSAPTVVVERAVKISSSLPPSPSVVASLAKLHVYQGRYELAEREYNTALQQLPNLSYTWANLGSLNLLRGRTQAAVLDFQRALLLDEHNSIATNKLAKIELEQGNLHAAKRLYARTLLIPWTSVHAERTWRIYHVMAAESDDIVPAGLLYYTSPAIEPLNRCDEWLIDLSKFGAVSAQARNNIRMQENFCNSH